MFYLVSTEKDRLDNIASGLEEFELDFVSYDWDDLNKIVKGIYIIENFPEDSKYWPKIEELLSSGNHIISISQNPFLSKFPDKTILKLSPGSQIKEIKSVLVWLDAQSNSTLELKSLNERLNSRTREMVTELSLASELQKNLLPKQ